ncbi:MAG: histidine phosphatase family protein [Lentimicrobium sp.]|jgi:phosphohistidine phosphatase|nr:histidine phosphatase family protein [Lentimicrobium sp.]
MKFLYLMRHGKAEADSAGSDADRQLSAKGEEQVRLVSTWFKSRNHAPQKIISSHASRAYTTAALLARELDIPQDKIDIQKAVYHGDEQTLEELIQYTDDNIEFLLMVGHNPAISDLASLFFQPAINGLPTAGLAVVTFDMDSWKSIGRNKVQSSAVVLPKMLK